MFLASQAKRIQNDYLQHCDSRYYKRIITISSKRVQKAIKRHKRRTRHKKCGTCSTNH